MQNEYIDEYQLLKDAYNGGGGFSNGGYLIKHPRENEKKYNMRLNSAYYLNYTAPCVDAHTAPIFKKMALRDYKGPGAKLWENFINNVDFLHTHINNFMRRVGHVAKLYGVAFIVMDRPQDAEIENTLAGLERDRQQLPYMFCIEPLYVKEIKVDKFGNIVKFVYEEIDEQNENTRNERTLTPQGWTLSNAQNGQRKTINAGTWNLNRVPVVVVPSKDYEAQRPFVMSDFYNIAQTNKAIYNYTSQLQEILVNQTFSVLVYPSNDVENDLDIGPSNALAMPLEASTMPQFIAPSEKPAVIIQDTIKSLQEEIYRMAGVVNITGVRSQQSGVAKAWDFEQTNQKLADFADRLEHAEKQIAELFKKWLNVEFDYICEYPSDFNISDIDTELANAEIAQGLAFGDAFGLEIFKKVLTAYLPSINDAKFDELVKEYQLEQEKAERDRANIGIEESDDDGARFNS